MHKLCHKTCNGWYLGLMTLISFIIELLTLASFTVIERLSFLRGKIVLPWSCRDQKVCPLYRGVLYSECPLKEVPM